MAGSNPTADQAEFMALVRDVLNHLHEYPYLDSHPLALRCWPESHREGPSRGQRLHRLVLETIESLAPANRAAHNEPQADRYLLLVYRYVEGRELAEVMQELSCSRRQYFRLQHKALQALATLLWERLPPPEQAAERPDDLLAHEAELVVAQREAVQVAEVVRGVVAAAQPLAQERRVALDYHLAGDAAPVHVNRTLLRQALLKLLNDLIALPGSRRVSLRAEGGRQRVTVETKVERSGSEREPLEAQAMPSLGLARRLVELMGGRWCGGEASPDAWCYRFELPADTQKTLLAIEDNEAVVRAYGRYLAGYGYRVVGATSGADALRLANELAPAAITLDIMMPRQDGWEVLQALKNDAATRDIPVIICSVLDDPDLARSLGAAAYLHKPVSQVDLLGALQRLPGLA